MKPINFAVMLGVLEKWDRFFETFPSIYMLWELFGLFVMVKTCEMNTFFAVWVRKKYPFG
jgi:hypothetical protein